MSKRRKIMINNLEVSVEEDAEILEYIDTNQSYQIADENQEAQFICTTGEQFTMEDGTIVQYIEPEYSMEEDEILQDQDQENEEVNNFENLDDESMKYSYIIINGEREGSYFLYCNKQLYKKNRSKYYRCRLFPNCTGSGRIYDDKMFHLQQPHGDHPDQESYKESLELFNTLRGKSKDNASNFNIIYEEECSKQESPQVVDDTKNEFLATKILKRNRDAFKILTEILGDQDYENINDSDRPLNNYEKTEINAIDGLGIRTKIIYSAGHIYLHTNTSTYRCYLYPKCLAAGNLVTEQSVSLFQLNVPHSDHGFKDTERDILHFVVAVKKRVQVNPNNMSHIFNEELQKDNYAYLKDKISLDTLIRLFVRLGSYPHDDDEDKAKIGSDEDSYLEIPRPFSIIDGGSGGHVLFCDGQLYNSNSRAGYYRCRLYQSGCPATGIRENKKFILMRSHLGHANQVTEKIKLQLSSALRRRAATESLPLQTIYNQEMRNPEFKLVSHLLPYHAVYKNMKRARTHGLSSDKLDSSDNNVKEKQKDTSEKIVENSSDTTKSKNEHNESKSSMKVTEVNADSIDEDLTNISPKSNNYRSNKVKNPQFPCMKYSLMEGERLGSCILYCNEQLYTLNRNNYYRCRMYPQGCQATGMREENYFRLCRGHSGHGSQEPERRRIILINTIKKKTMTNPDPDYFESVFNRECEKPEYADIVERVSFTVILNNMRKIWKRYQQQDPTLTRNIMRNDMPEDLHQKMTERESKDVQSEQDETEDLKMAVEIGDDIFCDQDISPKPYTLMEGERLGSCLLYSNQQLYTNNQRNYYRCRMYSIGCRATGIIKDNLFYLLKPHNSHGSQEREVRRLVLITRIKRRAQIDPSRLQTIFNEECSKQEFSDVAEMVNFKKIYSTLDRCRRRAANDVLEVIEPKIPSDITIAEKESSLKDQWTTDISGEQTEHMTEDGVQYFIQNVEPAYQENSESEIINPDESYLVENNDGTEALEQEAPEHEQQMTQEELITQLGLADSGGEENVYENESGASEEIAQQGENYEFIGGDRFGSKLLYSEGQLYCLNRDNYFRCRIYPNCIATGRVYGDQFRLHRGHSIHDLQVDEKGRLLFINILKKRVQEDLTTPIKQIFDDECSKPEYKSVAFLLNYKTVFSTLMKCRTRAQISTDKGECADQQQSSDQLDILQDYGTRFDNGLNKDDVNNDHDENLNPTWDLDEFSDSDMEDLVEVPKPDMNTPTKYMIIQGDRTGSLILYSNGHLYTRNRGSYYRCRLHPACYGSGNRRGNLFYMTRQHNNHPLQDDEKCRLALMNVLKRRVLQETTPLKVIYDEEIIKPEFSAIADLVSFKMIQSTMIKIRERVKYGQEPGTVMLSTEAVPLCSKSEIDENESIENEEGVDSDADESEIKKKLEKESSDDRYIYYYVLDYDETDDAEIEMENFCVNLGESVTREYLNSPKPKTGMNEIPSTQPIVVYTVDIDYPEENIPSFKRKVHLPDEELHEEISRTAVTSTQIEMQEPLSYKIIEDCLNEQYLLYAGKQLYSKKKNSFFGCRIRTCQAVGQIRDNSFYLLYNHINHPLQNKVKLQLQLIARIKSRSLERRTARVSKIFRHECTRPEFRNVANTITLDGISDMVRKYRRKYFPKMTNPPIEMISGSMLPDLPPPVEFSMVNGTTPDVRLLHCGDALFYHSSKGVYRCHVKGCGSFGRRDRIFFQLLSPHIEHDAVDINDKDNLLHLIKQIEEDIWKRNLMGDDENENDSLHDENQKVADQEQEKQIPQIKFEIQAEDTVVGHGEMQLDDIHKDNQDNYSNNSINQSSTKSILQQAWEELQVHI